MVSERHRPRAGRKMRNPLSNDLAALSRATRAFIDREKGLFIDRDGRGHPASPAVKLSTSMDHGTSRNVLM